MDEIDHKWMQHALRLARRAQDKGEVPVGAVIVCDSEIIAEGWNQPIGTHDPSAHAEMIAIRAAARHKKNYRLSECELYVTLEPCVMCAGAIVQARLKQVVFGAADPKAGAAESVFSLLNAPQLNHRSKVVGGVLAAECGKLLQDFFQSRR